MDQNENTKSGPELEQPQSPGPQDSASQADEPGNMKAESPRKCKICGSPNHHGCGCEAKAAKEWPGEDAPPGGQSESETPAPSESETDKALEDVLSPDAIVKSHKLNIQIAKDIKTMADGFEGLCACMYDTNNYLKVMAGDLITIRKMLSKEDDPRLISIIDNLLPYLSNIEQQLKEINARGQNASENKN